MKHAFLATATMAAALVLSTAAHATLVAFGSVGGAPTGVSLESFDSLTPGSAASASLAHGLSVSFAGDAKAVQGGSSGVYAPPFLSGNNGAAFGQSNGADATTYLSSGSTGAFPGAAISFAFAAPAQYFGLLWGSIDSFNALAFYSGATLVGTLTGADVLAGANGDQGVQGTLYVNINSTLAFDRVVATSTQYAFELDNVAFSPMPVSVPEPVSLGLLAAGLAGLGLMRRKRRAARS